MVDSELYQALQNIQTLKNQLKEMQDELRKEGLDKIKEIMTTLEISVADIRREFGDRRYGKAPDKYASPRGETWTGRGRMPKWLANLIEQGFKKEDFLIKK